MLLFFYPASVNPSFLWDKVKTMTTSSNFCIVRNKTMQTFDIVSKEIHHPSVNRFDGVILWYDFDYQKKSEDNSTK